MFIDICTLVTSVHNVAIYGNILFVICLYALEYICIGIFLISSLFIHTISQMFSCMLGWVAEMGPGTPGLVRP